MESRWALSVSQSRATAETLASSAFFALTSPKPLLSHCFSWRRSYGTTGASSSANVS